MSPHYRIFFLNTKSKKPVGFFSGETGPKPEQFSDMSAWNKKHGLIWIIYGVILILVAVVCIFIESGLVMTLVYCGGYLIPIPFMIARHLSLEKKYVTGK